jgi:hypothetical protein
MIPVSRPRQRGCRQQAECNTYSEDRTKIPESPYMLLTCDTTRPPAVSLMSEGFGGPSNVSCCSPTQVHSMRVPMSTNRGIKVSRPKCPIFMRMLWRLGSLLYATCDWLRVVYRCCCPQRAKVGLQHNDAESVADPSELRLQGGCCTAAKAHTETSHGCYPDCQQLIQCT